MDSRSCELESACTKHLLYSPSGLAISNKPSSRGLHVVELARCLCSNVRCLQRAMKHVQGAHCGIYGLLLFQVVSSFLEQFPRTLDEYSFRFRNTAGEFGGWLCRALANFCSQRVCAWQCSRDFRGRPFGVTSQRFLQPNEETTLP